MILMMYWLMCFPGTCTTVCADPLTAKILGFVYYDVTDFILGQVIGMIPVPFLSVMS